MAPAHNPQDAHEYDAYIPATTLQHVPVYGWVLISLLFVILLGSYILGQCLTWGQPTLTEKEWRRRREQEMEEVERQKRMDGLRNGHGGGGGSGNGNGNGNGKGASGRVHVDRVAHGIGGMSHGGMGGGSRLSGSTLGKAQGRGVPLGK
ncbi:hypothetical protein QBC32DRAFT_351235 [Pseudoneurospora amorphoporcata]|uniref:Uncharacterized protein n=1 Tax=Pseudoneurospora amorphoporcata TaxID=241081 RepID=A0AAN6NMY0_9PEZI|nr:hypothetical protein QBC32DRAFT_351235 [Pseudoneurospora amorphoporcata]